MSIWPYKVPFLNQPVLLIRNTRNCLKIDNRRSWPGSNFTYRSVFYRPTFYRHKWNILKSTREKNLLYESPHFRMYSLTAPSSSLQCALPFSANFFNAFFLLFVFPNCRSFCLTPVPVAPLLLSFSLLSLLILKVYQKIYTTTATSITTHLVEDIVQI